MSSSRMLQIAAELAKSSPPIDRLPYSQEFEGPAGVYQEFVRRLGRACSKGEVWWALQHARKAGMIGPSRRRHRERGGT